MLVYFYGVFFAYFCHFFEIIHGVLVMKILFRLQFMNEWRFECMSNGWGYLNDGRNKFRNLRISKNSLKNSKSKSNRQKKYFKWKSNSIWDLNPFSSNANPQTTSDSHLFYQQLNSIWLAHYNYSNKDITQLISPIYFRAKTKVPEKENFH